MAARTITSANSVFLLAVPGVFTAPVQLQEYAADEAFDTEAVDVAETQIGVDGTGVAGWVPHEFMMTISFLASSQSVDLFEEWNRQNDSIQEIYYASGVIRLPAVHKQVTLARGVLRRFSPQPNVRRVLQPRVFTITWLPLPGQPAAIVSPLS
jgi:hypothetical protein